MIAKTPLSLIQLGCFVTVAECGSFVEAGRRLGMTTSGVSKTISRMEAAGAIRLLNRSTHAISLTPEGERLLPVARAAIRGAAEVEAMMMSAAADGAGGRVRLGAPTAFLATCLAPLMSCFRSAHPRVALDLRGSDEMMDLADGAIDLVLRTGRLDGIPGHLSQTLFRFPWVTCASPDYLARRGAPTTPTDLAEHELIGFRNQRTGIVEAWRFGRRHTGPVMRLSPDAHLVLDDANAIAIAAVSGAGVAWAPRWLVSAQLGTGALVPLLSDWSCEDMQMSLVRREGRLPERTNQVIGFLKNNHRHWL